MISGSDIAREAKSLLGIRWASGGRSPGGVDCSGLCILASANAGLDLPTYVGQYDPRSPDPGLMRRALEGVGEILPPSEWAPGMLCLMMVPGTKGATHLGVYADDGQVYHMDPLKRKAVARSPKSLPGRIVCCVKLNGVLYG